MRKISMVFHELNQHYYIVDSNNPYDNIKREDFPSIDEAVLKIRDYFRQYKKFELNVYGFSKNLPLPLTKLLEQNSRIKVKLHGQLELKVHRGHN